MPAAPGPHSPGESANYSQGDLNVKRAFTAPPAFGRQPSSVINCRKPFLE